MTLDLGDLVLCAGTLQRASLSERAAAAAAAGFRGLSLFAADIRRAHAEGSSDADLRALLADHDLAVAELDPLISWLPGAAPPLPAFDADEDDFYAIHDALGARSINAVVFTTAPVPESAVVDAFGALCERAARHDLLVHLEFMPWTQVPDVLTAWRIVERAGQPNGGILLDTWHHLRSGAPNDVLGRDVPAERILAVQLNDAPAKAEPDVIAETLNRRRLPGAGDADVAGILRRLRDGDSPAPYGVEVFSEELFDLAPGVVAQRCADATRAAIAASEAPKKD